MKIPVRIAWDAVPEADGYRVYVQPDGADFKDTVTGETSIVLPVQERCETRIFISSIHGPLESIGSEEIHLFVARW